VSKSIKQEFALKRRGLIPRGTTGLAVAVILSACLVWLSYHHSQFERLTIMSDPTKVNELVLRPINGLADEFLKLSLHDGDDGLKMIVVRGKLGARHKATAVISPQTFSLLSAHDLLLVGLSGTTIVTVREQNQLRIRTIGQQKGLGTTIPCKNDVIVWHAAMLPFAGLWSDGRTQNHRAIAVFEPLTGEMVKTDMSIRPIEGGRLLEVVCVSTLREFLAIYERDGKTYRLKMVDYRRDPFLKGGGKYVVVEPAIHAVDS